MENHLFSITQASEAATNLTLRQNSFGKILSIVAIVAL